MDNCKDDDGFWEKNKMKNEPKGLKTNENGFPLWLNKSMSYVLGQESTQYLRNAWIVIGVEFVWLFIALMDVFTGGALSSHGIHPRLLSGAFGAIFAVLLHINFLHFLINSIIFFMFGIHITSRENGPKLLIFLTVIYSLLSGLFVWTFGRQDMNHVGTSGLVHTFYGYLVGSAVLRKNKYEAGVVSCIFLVYIFLLWGAMHPSNLSWEGHMFGLVLGGFIAFTESKFPPGKELNDFNPANTKAEHDIEKDNQLEENLFE